jgi:hypothetical protein
MGQVFQNVEKLPPISSHLVKAGTDSAGLLGRLKEGAEKLLLTQARKMQLSTKLESGLVILD